MRAILIAIALFVVCPVFAEGQATTANKFAIDQQAPDLATANSYVYHYYADGATTGQVIAMTCTGAASPFTCVAPIPAFTPGQHSVRFTAANVAGESDKSAPVLFTFVVVPSAPANPRVQ